MNIGFDAKRAFFNGSGLGNYSRSTINFMIKYFPANDYTLFTPSNEHTSFYSAPNNVKIIKPSGIVNHLSHSYWRTFRLQKFIKQNNIDIYHGLTNELPHNAHKTGAKLIVTIHDLIFMRFPELYKKIDREIYFQKFKYSCQIADTIIAISEQTKTDIIDFFGIDDQKIEVVYQSCNSSFYKEAEKSKIIETAQKYNLPENYILNVGNIEKRKNSLSILKAIHEHKIDIHLIIIGRKTEYQNEIENYAQKNKITDKLIILNDIPQEDLPAIYQQSTIMVYPSLFEGFGIPIIEGLFSKVPVITTKGGCFSEAGGMSSAYIEYGNIDDLANSILKILNDSDLRKKMIDDGYNYAQNFLEDKVASNIMNVYLK
jgi:glycosyltransferase involved in cell wall biosynthesis